MARHALTPQAPLSQRVQVAALARSHTVEAIEKMIAIMRGEAGEKTVVTKDGQTITVPVEVPAGTQLDAAIKLLERGWGKAPQAILIKNDTDDTTSARLSVMERIAQLRRVDEGQTKAGPDAPTIDLEAASIQEVTPLSDAAAAQGRAREFVAVKRGRGRPRRATKDALAVQSSASYV